MQKLFRRGMQPAFAAMLSAPLVDRDAKPAFGTVVLFPEDPAKWGDGSRLVKTTRPDQMGSFEIRTVPGGDYLIAALDYVQRAPPPAITLTLC